MGIFEELQNLHSAILREMSWLKFRYIIELDTNSYDSIIHLFWLDHLESGEKILMIVAEQNYQLMKFEILKS